MLDRQKINVCAPKASPASDYDAIGRHEEIDYATTPEEQEAIIRREYASQYPVATQGNGRRYTPSFMGYYYKMTPHAEAAWYCQKADGISLLPRFPFFHYFLDFADPYKKIAILVEEAESPWNQQTIEQQDELLSVAGWTTYRIPKEVADTYETNILPESMSRCPYGEFKDEEEHLIYLRYKPRLSTETIDGFFSWLKQEVYAIH